MCELQPLWVVLPCVSRLDIGVFSGLCQDRVQQQSDAAPKRWRIGIGSIRVRLQDVDLSRGRQLLRHLLLDHRGWHLAGEGDARKLSNCSHFSNRCENPSTESGLRCRTVDVGTQKVKRKRADRWIQLETVEPPAFRSGCECSRHILSFPSSQPPKAQIFTTFSARFLVVGFLDSSALWVCSCCQS